MRNRGLSWHSWCSRAWVPMATIKHLPGEQRENSTCQLILTESETELFVAAWFRSVFIQFLWFLFSTCLVGKLPCKQLQWWGSPCWPGVFCQRVWGCFLPDRSCNFSCCLPLPSPVFLWKLFVYHNSLLHQYRENLSFSQLKFCTVYHWVSSRVKSNEVITLSFSIFYVSSLFNSFMNLFIYVWEAVMTKGERE